MVNTTTFHTGTKGHIKCNQSAVHGFSQCKGFPYLFMCAPIHSRAFSYLFMCATIRRKAFSYLFMCATIRSKAFSSLFMCATIRSKAFSYLFICATVRCRRFPHLFMCATIRNNASSCHVGGDGGLEKHRCGTVAPWGSLTRGRGK